MRNRALGATLVMAAWMVESAPVVRNGDFSARPADDARVPADWALPAASPWHSTNADGYSGQDSLRYRTTTEKPAGPVVQKVVLAADTSYVLSAALKGDGKLRPLVRVRADGEGGVELGRVTAEGPSGVWQRRSVRFTSGQVTRAVVEVWADPRQYQGYPAPAGIAGVDDVRIVTEAEAALAADAKDVISDENLARGKNYTLQPRPSYALCTDPADKTQLTDGQYTVGYFWTQKTTVGWSRARPVVITVDLGADLPIRGVSFSTAAGVAGVEWPTSIFVLTSVDGRVYHSSGNLVELSRADGAPPQGEYSSYRFSTRALKTHGRYVKLFVDPAGAYCFVDEIEVYRGEDAWLRLPLPGEGIRHPMEYYEDNIFSAAVKRRLGVDLIAVQEAVQAAKLPKPVRARLLREAAGLVAAIGELPEISAEGFRAVFPLNEIHGRTYAIYGAMRKARGRAPVVPWTCDPLDFLTPAELPEEPPAPVVSIAAMRGEIRAGVVNLTNCTEKSLTARVTFGGLPGGTAPPYLSVHEVAWTDTLEGTPVAAALPAAAR